MKRDWGNIWKTEDLRGHAKRVWLYFKAKKEVPMIT
jgi:hypothetical protein